MAKKKPAKLDKASKMKSTPRRKKPADSSYSRTVIARRLRSLAGKVSKGTITQDAAETESQDIYETIFASHDDNWE